MLGPRKVDSNKNGRGYRCEIFAAPGQNFCAAGGKAGKLRDHYRNPGSDAQGVKFADHMPVEYRGINDEELLKQIVRDLSRKQQLYERRREEKRPQEEERIRRYEEQQQLQIQQNDQQQLQSPASDNRREGQTRQPPDRRRSRSRSRSPRIKRERNNGDRRRARSRSRSQSPNSPSYSPARPAERHRESAAIAYESVPTPGTPMLGAPPPLECGECEHLKDSIAKSQLHSRTMKAELGRVNAELDSVKSEAKQIITQLRDENDSVRTQYEEGQRAMEAEGQRADAAEEARVVATSALDETRALAEQMQKQLTLAGNTLEEEKTRSGKEKMKLESEVSREVYNNKEMSKKVTLMTKEAVALRTKVEQFKTEQGVQEQVIKDTKEALALCSGELSASQAREEKSQELLRASQEALRVERKNQKVVKDEHARHRKKVAAQLKTAKAEADDARKELKHNVKFMAEENFRKAKITWKAMIEGAKGVTVKLEAQEEGHQQEVERMTQGHEQAVGQLTGAHASALVEVQDQVSTLEDNLNTSTICCVCEVTPKDTVLEPCGHVCVCEACATLVTDSDNKCCPLCREEITGRRRVYL